MEPKRMGWSEYAWWVLMEQLARGDFLSCVLCLQVLCLLQCFDLGRRAVKNSRRSGSKGVSVVTLSLIHI